MRIDVFRGLFDKPFILDGAAGTKLMELGLPPGQCPEKWASQNLDKLTDMHSAYIDAGAQAIYAFTFGANRNKLAEFGLEAELHDINMRNCEAACEAALSRNVLVGGDISPLSGFIEPLGDVSFDTAVDIYGEQAQVLAQAGADFLIIETMLDIQNVRAAIIGAKEACSLPVVATLAFDETGHTLTGSDAEAVAAALCALGVDGIGANCGIGPGPMIDVIRQLNRHSNVPVFAKPNAGLPTGESMAVDDYAAQAVQLVEAGASAIGGCCGTSYEHIAEIAKRVQGMSLKPWGADYAEDKLSSLSGVAHIRKGGLCAIGERINPTGKKDLQAALKADDLEHIIGLANEQKAAGAQVLDINVGMQGIDEVKMLKKAALEVAGRVHIPLCLDSANMAAMEPALRAYPGRALLNSITAESGKAEALLPLVDKYGCMYVALPIGDEGMPETAAQRIALVEQILAMATAHGIPKSRAIVDVLALAIGSDNSAGKQALEVVQWCRGQGLHCMMGVSNISFGLPGRPAFNSAMLTAAMQAGMDAAIINVCDSHLRASLQASRAIIYSEDISAYTRLFTKQQQQEGLYGVVLAGDKGNAEALVRRLLQEGEQPADLVDKQLLPALDEVGRLFGEKELFLPQLMASADAAKLCFALLEPLMQQKAEAKATAVIATVKGDIHDIGKNIVALMLRNHGFNVIDLGRDVDNDDILNTAKKTNADIIALSALITTTMPRMGECAEMMRQQNIDCALMVGGAVVTRGYAESIGALYSKDAAEAVVVAKEALKIREKSRP